MIESAVRQALEADRAATRDTFIAAAITGLTAAGRTIPNLIAQDAVMIAYAAMKARAI